MNLQILFVTVLLSNFVSFKSHATKAFSDFRNICEQRTETLMKSKTDLDIKIKNLLHSPLIPIERRYAIEIMVQTCMHKEVSNLIKENPRALCRNEDTTTEPSDCLSNHFKDKINLSSDIPLVVANILTLSVEESKQAKDREVAYILLSNRLIKILESVDLKLFYVSNIKPANMNEEKVLIELKQIEVDVIEKFYKKFSESIIKRFPAKRVPTSSSTVPISPMEKWKQDSKKYIQQRLTNLKTKKWSFTP